MNRGRGAVVVAIGACALLGSVASARAQPPKMPSALIKVSGTCTRRDGPTGGGALSARRLMAGESYTFGLFDNNFNGVGMSDWPRADWPGQYAWRVGVKLLSVQIDTVRFELDWARYDKSSKTRAPVVGDTRVVTLKKGRRHVLDLVQSTSAVSPLANIVIEVEASDVVDPPYAALLIGYDLWLVQENEAGQKTTRHVELSGAQDEAKRFSFEPIEFELPFRSPASIAHPNVKMLTGGEVSARLQPDGTFEITLMGERTFDCGGGSAGGGTGSRSFVARPGETVGVVVPNYPVGCAIPVGEATATSLPRGVTVEDGRARIAFDEFFHGDKTSFLVTVKRLH